jgi:hypothetical protein
MFRKLFGSALLVVLFASCGGDGVSGSVNVGNLPPSFTSSASASVPEDTAGVFYTATATDMNNDPLTFSILGGPDAGFFDMTPAGGLSFSSPPDFELPGDVGGDNTYDVQIGVSDGFVTTAMFVAVTVTDRQSVNFRVRRVIDGLPSPVFVAAVPDNSGRVFVGELAGRIRMLNPSNGVLSLTPFLDLRGQLSTNGERGLLGFATAPDYATSGVFYVFVTDLVGTIELRRYRRSASNADVADPTTMEVILRQPHPLANHNGGWIGFGPDGMLFVAIGDGGGSGDPDNNAQALDTWLGKILRIDVAGDDFPGDTERNYAIPDDNPFATIGGLPEIWAYGLRNPFRASVYVPPSQPGAGVLIIGDVGQDVVEEIDVAVEGGQNFGWSIREGTRQFKGPDSVLFTPPAAEYLHGTGTRNGDTVIGGLIYRGPVESLRDLYFFGDFIRGNLWTLPRDALFGTDTVPSASFTVGNTRYAPDVGAMNNIVSFGEDQQFNLYIVDMDGEIFVIEAAPAGTPAQRARSAPSTRLRHWCEEEWDGRTLRWRKGELILGGEGFTCVRKFNERRASRATRFDVNR